MIIIVSHILLLVAIFLLKIVGIGDAFLGIIFSCLSIIIIVSYVLRNKDIDKASKIIMLAGFAIRIVLLVIDVYFKRIPLAGSDDNDFYDTSIAIYNNNIAAKDAHGGFYPVLLSLFYFLAGSSRISAQYLNAALFVFSIVLLYKSLIILGVDRKKILISTILVTFIPYSIIVNSILRRETIIELFVCGSFYYFALWKTNAKKKNVILTIGCCALASLFHIALAFAIPLMVMYFGSYNKTKKSLSFTPQNIIKMALLLAITIFVGAIIIGTFSNKLSSISNLDDIFVTATKTRGGSVYLADYTVTNIKQFILFTPLKLLYFLISPMPWDFRNITDILAFVADSLVYACLMICCLKGKKDSTSKFFLLLFISLSIIYAIGTFTSGTAIRHRLTLLPYLLVSYCATKKRRKSDKLQAEISTKNQQVQKNENTI